MLSIAPPLGCLQLKDVMAARLEEAPEPPKGPGANARGPARQKLTAPSLGAQFTRQLNSLMGKLHATQPHFIKCIKPNTEKKGGLYIVDEARLPPANRKVRETQLLFPRLEPLNPVATGSDAAALHGYLRPVQAAPGWLLGAADAGGILPPLPRAGAAVAEGRREAGH